MKTYPFLSFHLSSKYSDQVLQIHRFQTINRLWLWILFGCDHTNSESAIISLQLMWVWVYCTVRFLWPITELILPLSSSSFFTLSKMRFLLVLFFIPLVFSQDEDLGSLEVSGKILSHFELNCSFQTFLQRNSIDISTKFSLELLTVRSSSDLQINIVLPDELDAVNALQKAVTKCTKDKDQISCIVPEVGSST